MILLKSQGGIQKLSVFEQRRLTGHLDSTNAVLDTRVPSDTLTNVPCTSSCSICYPQYFVGIKYLHIVYWKHKSTTK